MAAFVLPRQNCVAAAAETTRAAKPKIFAAWPFTEKFLAAPDNRKFIINTREVEVSVHDLNFTAEKVDKRFYKDILNWSRLN